VRLAAVKVQVWQGWRLDSLRLAWMTTDEVNHWLEGVTG
jgi:hypothetical protein